MSYRDEEESLRHRVETLEGEPRPAGVFDAVSLTDTEARGTSS